MLSLISPINPTVNEVIKQLETFFDLDPVLDTAA